MSKSTPFLPMLLCLWLLFSQTAVSEPLPAAEGRIILSVSGQITNTNDQGMAHFDRALLESLPKHQFSTTTPWTEGSHVYEGVLLSDLLDYVGARGSKLVARALNDYHSVIQLADIQDYPILLALRSDGQTMRVRDKGPIWILYPMSDYPVLDSTYHHAGMVWQLRHLEVR